MENSACPGNSSTTSSSGPGSSERATLAFTRYVTAPDDASRTSTSSGYGCSGNFWNGCSGGQSYEFSWNFGADAFNGLTSLNLQPGESMTYLFGTFTPRPAGADAGTYSFSSSHAAFWVYGKSADGDDLQQWVSLAQTCPGGGDCAFTRVVEVPEPGTYALMGAGSLLLGWVARRRRMR